MRKYTPGKLHLKEENKNRGIKRLKTLFITKYQLLYAKLIK